MENREAGNTGRIPLRFDGSHWEMESGEVAPSAREFETFVETLESFIEGFFCAMEASEIPVYCRGDFMNERSEAIFFSDPNFLPDKLYAALSRWLDAPKRSNWRVLFPERDVAIYCSEDARSNKEEAEQGGDGDAEEAV